VETILERLEREMIVRAMKEFAGNQVRASDRLGITRATLRKRLDIIKGVAQGVPISDTE
jgi:two-component system nitrogen regulation response regulator GlnG